MADTTKRAALVVGASSGMGRAIAESLAQTGWQVTAAARRRERLQELQDKFGADKLLACAVDVTERTQVDQAVVQTLGHFGRIDLLVYATGTNIPQRSLDSLSIENWQSLLATNLTGALHCTQAVLPTLRKQGGGLIVYISTGAVQRPDVSGVAYQASKHGLTGLAHGTRVEEKDRGIRTTLLFTGLCDTEILLQRPTPTPPEVMAHALQPQDIADAVMFLANLPPRVVVPELQLFPSRLW